MRITTHKRWNPDGLYCFYRLGHGDYFMPLTKAFDHFRAFSALGKPCGIQRPDGAWLREYKLTNR